MIKLEWQTLLNQTKIKNIKKNIIELKKSFINDV